MRGTARWASLILFLLPLPAAAQTGPGQSPAVIAQRRITVTIDDLPWVGREAEDSIDASTDRLLASLIGWRVPAVGFVNGHSLEWHRERQAHRLARWLASGMELGNHGHGHRSANDIPLADYRVSILRGERAIQALSRDHGTPLRYFRHPYLHTGPDAVYRTSVERFLEAHGYRTAPVTIDLLDWIYARAYAAAHWRGDAGLARRVGEEYLAHIAGVAAFIEEYSRELLGYEPPQILLLHANQLNARYLGSVLTLFRRRGYRFVTLDEALRDPAYALPVGGDAREGVSWLHRWAAGQGRDPSAEPVPAIWITSLASIAEPARGRLGTE